MSPAPGGRAGFHNTSAGILHITSVPALQHVSCCCSRDSSIRCCIHCSTSLLYQRLLRPSLIRFREMTFTDQLGKTIYRSCQWNWWCSSCRSGSSTRSNTLSWPVIESTWSEYPLWDLWRVRRMQGKMLNRAFRAGLLRDTGDYWRWQRASDRAPRRSRAKSLNAHINSLSLSSQSGERLPSTTSRVICFWYGALLPRWRRSPVRYSSIQYQPVQFRAIEILLSDAQHPWYSRFSGWRVGSQQRITSGVAFISALTVSIKSIPNPRVCLLLKALSCSRQTKQDPPYPGAGLFTQRTIENADDFVLIRWPEGAML